MEIKELENRIINADCMDILKQLPDKSIDMILCDLPYGTTACKWDIIIPFEPLWDSYERIIKDDGAIVLFGSEPFSSLLRTSNLKMFKYDWVWNKKAGLGFLDSKYRPLKSHEMISVFGKGGVSNGSKKIMKYNPQGLIKTSKKNSNSKSNILNSEPKKRKELNTQYKNYPKSIIEFARESGLHPTQKPVALFEYLIKTYTQPNELVLDNCSGSGTTAIASIRTGRRFICIEKDPEYWKASCKRLEDEQRQGVLF